MLSAADLNRVLISLDSTNPTMGGGGGGVMMKLWIKLK